MDSAWNIAALARWDREDPGAPDAIDLVLAQPGFDVAARALGAKSLALYESDSGIAGVTKDGGRYVVAMLAIYLHVAGGLTLPSLKALCATFGMVSPGRARALLLYMRYLNYVEPAPKAVGGGPARFVPTPSFIAAWRRLLAAAVEATAEIEPALKPWLDRLCAPHALDVLTRIQTEGLRIAIQGHKGYSDRPIYRTFVNRHAGSQVLWLLVTPQAAAFPPERSPPVSAAALARRLQVSRVHVRRMLDDAARQGLARLDADGTMVFEPRGVDEIRLHFAVQLASLLRAAVKTLQELDMPARQVA